MASGHIASTSGDFSTVGYFDAWRMCICHGDYSNSSHCVVNKMGTINHTLIMNTDLSDLNTK